jgi:tRNA pseudouridine55 synthase
MRDGVLNIDKAEGWTSHDVVAKVRTLLGGVRVGHAGTLDPLATGVLPILVGRATRIAEYLVGWDKAYRAVLRLGETTDTQDRSGSVTDRRDAAGVSGAAVREVVERFRGPLMQTPPMYSAIKIAGVPLYKAARAGRTVERRPRPVVVHELSVLEMSASDVMLDVVCSKGTYIRTLCADIGEALGVGAHLRSLVRTRVGPLRLEDASTVEQVAAAMAAGGDGVGFIGLDEALSTMPDIRLDDIGVRRAVHGAPVARVNVLQWPDSGTPQAATLLRLKDREGRLLGLGIYDAETIRMTRLLNDSPVHEVAARP